jgi:hypothetical protein
MEKAQHNIDTHKDTIHRVLFLVILLLKGVVVSVPVQPVVHLQLGHVFGLWLVK